MVQSLMGLDLVVNPFPLIQSDGELIQPVFLGEDRIGFLQVGG